MDSFYEGLEKILLHCGPFDNDYSGITKYQMQPAQSDQVKQAARELLHMLKGERLVLDWRKQQRARAAVQVTIEKVLDDRLPSAYDKEWFGDKCDRVYNHIYEKYYGAGRSVYAPPAG